MSQSVRGWWLDQGCGGGRRNTSCGGGVTIDLKYILCLIKYFNKPYYIGAGDPNLSVWRNFNKGKISELGLWSEALETFDIELIFENGIVNKSPISWACYKVRL